MRRRAVPLALTFAALAALPGHAAPGPTAMVDPKGDWAVAGQDITAVRVGTVTVAGKPALRAEIDLAAAPNVPTTFTVNLSRDGACEWWSLLAYDHGSPAAKATLEKRTCSSDVDAQTVTGAPDATAAATAEVRGSTVVLTAPYALGLARGVRLRGISAVASTRFVGVWTMSPADGSWSGAESGDWGFGDFRYTLR